MKILCKIIRIDEKCGAVVVRSLRAQDDDDVVKDLWISPDDLVGIDDVSNYLNRKSTKSTSIEAIKKQSCQSSSITISPPQIRQNGRKHVSPVNETIDLTGDDDESDVEVIIESVRPFAAKSEFRPQASFLASAANLSAAKVSPEKIGRAHV